MVDPEDFEEARQLLAEEIEKAFEGKWLIPPVELASGHWVFWPSRKVDVTLKETYFWNYGVPKGGTDDLQAHIYTPANELRIKPRKGGKFGRKEAKKAAAEALKRSEIWAKHYGDDAVEPQEAYIDGYEKIQALPEEDLVVLWEPRRETVGKASAEWKPLWDLIMRYAGHKQRAPLEWMPDEEPTKYHGKLYNLYLRGALNALDDWARERGLVRFEGGPALDRWVLA